MMRLASLLVGLILWASAASATTYYVSTTGNDANPGTIGSPFLTIVHGVGVLRAGDTLYIRAGTYYEALVENNFAHTGTAWTAGNYITVGCYPGETCTIASTGETIRFQDGSKHHIRFQGGDSTHRFTIDGVNQSSQVDGIVLCGGGCSGDTTLSHDIDLTDVEVKNTYANGILAGGIQHEWRNLYIHDNGRIPASVYPQGANGIYASTVVNLRIIGGRFIGNKCYGIRIGSSDPLHQAHDDSIEGAVITHNGIHIGLGGTSDCGSTGGGAVLENYNIKLINSVVAHNMDGVYIYPGGGNAPTNVEVYNNTIVSNVGIGIDNGTSGPWLPPVGTKIKNNIVYSNGTDFADGGTGTVTATNIFTDPSFISAGTENYHLQSGSAARNVCTNLTSDGVTSDLDGVARPQGTGTPSGYDCGAFEYPQRLRGQLPDPVRQVRLLK